jgi:hypothetical protein
MTPEVSLSVNDSGAGDAADAREAVAAMGQQRIDQGAVGRAGRGVGGHARRLVDDDKVGVLVENGQGNGLGLGRGRRDGRQGDGIEAGLGLGGTAGQDRAIAADSALGQQGLEPGARQGREGAGQGLVQASAGRVDAGLQHLGGGAGRGVFVVIDQILGGHVVSLARPAACARGAGEAIVKLGGVGDIR